MPKEKLPRSVVLAAVTDKLKASHKHSVNRCWMEVVKLGTTHLKKEAEVIALALDGIANTKAGLPVTKAQARAIESASKDKTLIKYLDEQEWLS